jgi:hypothetical protein
MADDALPPINSSLAEGAASIVRRALERAERGDPVAKRDLLRMAASEALETTLIRVAGFADKCAPSLDELKINRGSFSADAQQLRFEVDLVPNVLNQAAGRAVVVELPASRAAPGDIIERDGADHSHDSGEFPRPPVLGGAA